MKKILFVAFILGVSIAEIFSSRDSFEFHDNQGRCWRCQPGASCVRCPSRANTNVGSFPPGWNRECPAPTTELCNQFPTARFPSRRANLFYQCGANGANILAQCGCDLVFDMTQQNCVTTDELQSVACTNFVSTEGTLCVNGVIPPIPTNGETVVSTTVVPVNTTTSSSCVCVMWWPCACNPCWSMPCHSCNGCVG